MIFSKCLLAQSDCMVMLCNKTDMIQVPWIKCKHEYDPRIE